MAESVPRADTLEVIATGLTVQIKQLHSSLEFSTLRAIETWFLPIFFNHLIHYFSIVFSFLLIASSVDITYNFIIVYYYFIIKFII